MRKANFVQTLLIAFLVLGCGTPALPPHSTVASPTTTIPTLTSTPQPTPTEKPATPTLTPEPGLRTNGPYFAYFRTVEGRYQLVMMDADGEGRKVINLPQGIVDSFPDKQNDLDVKYISPDGHWLAFYTGSAGSYGAMPAPGTSNLTLNLLDLSTGETHVITSLLSKDYPDNFAKAAKELNDPYKTAETLFEAFQNGITRALAWSPDGKYLAFAGQMDGLSSDLYLYDAETKTIQRLSSGDQELQWINWSPDGKWVLHGSVLEVGMGTLDNIYAASLDGSSVKHLVKASGMEEWVDPHTFIVNDNQNVFGNFEFRLVDIETGSVHKIWDGPVLFAGLNSNERKFAIFAHMFGRSPYVSTEPDLHFVPGLYLIDLKTLKKTYIESLNDTSQLYSISSFGVGENIFAFIGQGTDQDSYFFSKTGDVSSLGIKGVETVESSPDASLWIAVTDKGINIYSASNVLINSIDLPFHDLLAIQRAEYIWQPDSSGIILISGTNIYFVNIATGETKLVENNFLEDFLSQNYTWINN